MTRDQLLTRLRGRETEDFEVKTAANEVPEDAYSTVSAFANTSGGWIVFGVRSEQEEARFLRDASGEPFDWAVCEEAELADLDPESLQWFRGILAQKRPREHFPEERSELLAKVGLLRHDRLTNAAVLLLGREQAVAALKPGGLVDFRLIHDRWHPTSPAYRWHDRELCEGNLIAAFRSLAERLYRLCPQPFAMDPNGLQHQTESPDFRAAREALVNLLIHQDFADRVRTATIWWYKDKAIFENSGDSDLSPEELLAGGRSAPRNQTLLRLMRQLGFAEQAGTGIPEIVRVWTEANRQPPQIVNDPGRKIFRLTLELDWNNIPSANGAERCGRSRTSLGHTQK